MDTENQNFIDSNPKRYKIGNIIEITKLNLRKKIIIQNKNIKFLFFISIMALILLVILFNTDNKEKKKFFGKIKVNNYVELPEVSFQEFNESVLHEINMLQMEFCSNQSKYIKYNFENEIKLAKASLLNKNYYMYIYKDQDIVSYYINLVNNYEATETKKIIKALDPYSSLKNISNDDIYILDIGANIGWYTFFFGKCGYHVLSFEPSDVNIYILRKNFCLNPNVNITLIKKALYTYEKKCDYYEHKGNIGNGLILCDNNPNIKEEYIKTGETYLTKLSNYIEFLSTKNLVFIKMDIEGSEGKAFESGIELISKYHVPFIFLEFTPKLHKLHEFEPIKFLEMFEMNGYKFAKTNYFDKNYYTKEEIMEKAKSVAINLFIIHSNIYKYRKE